MEMAVNTYYTIMYSLDSICSAECCVLAFSHYNLAFHFFCCLLSELRHALIERLMISFGECWLGTCLEREKNWCYVMDHC